MSKTKTQLLSDNNSSFPNNNTQFITPEKLRTFNTDFIDSTVNQIEYDSASAEINQSISSLEAFTASQQPTFDALNDFTASQLTINSGYNNTTSSLLSSISALDSEVSSLTNWTGSVNEIRDDGVLQGYSTRLHFYGNVSASIVQNVGGPIASIAITDNTGSLLTTASYSSQNLTFTKGDGSQFSVFIPDDSGSVVPQ